MKLSKRLVFSILFVMTVLLFGMFFWPFILHNIIEPISLVIWLLLRIFVLSIDQKYYWGAVIFLVILLLFRFLTPDHIAVQSDDLPDSNAAIKAIGYWRILFTPIEHTTLDQESLKRELIHLLLSYYASKQRTSTNYALYEALQKGELPLPAHIHAFLFPERPKKSKQSLDMFIRSIRTAFGKWMRLRTGQETAEHYRMINEVLSFMESSMEMKNDDNGKSTPNKY